MIFQIPEDLTILTPQALTAMRTTAATEYNTLLASMGEDVTLNTDDNRGRLDSLKTFYSDAQREIDSRKAAESDLASREPLTLDAVQETPTEFRVADVAPLVDNSDSDGVGIERQEYGQVFASANVNGVAEGTQLDMMGVTKAFLSKLQGFGALEARGTSDVISQQFAYLRRDYPTEFSVFGNDSDDEVLRNVSNEFRLDVGGIGTAVAKRHQQALVDDSSPKSLLAFSGWCAPSETLYDTCFQGVIDGLIDVPEVQARRGGIRHNQGIDFNNVYGSGTGFFNLTEAQVAAGTTKTCIEIPCPSFVDDRLGVTGLCITGNILQNRAYPEFVRDWMRAAMVVSAHQINSLQVADMVTGSTAVSLAAPPVDPWNTDGTVTSQLLAAVEMAIVDMKYRLRMARSATLEIVFPFWVLAQFRADLSRQNGGDALGRQAVTDSQIMSWFALRGARPQFILDWQDAFAPTDVIGGAALAPGSATAITQFPTGVKFLAYPAGTWVRAVNDVITLNAVYDSTKLVTNQLTQLFTETGWKMMRMCPLSRVYTVAICPSGSTGAQRAVDCVNP